MRCRAPGHIRCHLTEGSHVPLVGPPSRDRIPRAPRCPDTSRRGRAGSMDANRRDRYHGEAAMRSGRAAEQAARGASLAPPQPRAKADHRRAGRRREPGQAASEPRRPRVCLLQDAGWPCRRGSAAGEPRRRLAPAAGEPTTARCRPLSQPRA